MSAIGSGHHRAPAAAAPDDERNPFKGQDSYDVEDAELFFGRERESKELTATVLGYPVTVLNAPSGVGKTSLLNARLIPQLEVQGWVPVRVRPGDHVSESIRTGVLRYLLPPPEAEAFALRAAVRALERQETAAFGDLASAYDDRLPADRRPLIRPVLNTLEWTDVDGQTRRPDRMTPFTSAADVLPGFPSASPYVCRVWRTSMEMDRAGVHLATMLGAGAPSEPDRTAADRATLNRLSSGALASVPVSDLLRLLDAPASATAYRDLLGRLYLPLPGLRPFFDHLFSVYAGHQNQLGIVLLIDQFEEVFTRFRKTRPREARRRRSYRRAQPGRQAVRPPTTYQREQFFQDFRLLYRPGPLPRDLQGGVAPEQPIRFVFSLREEYASRLMAVLRRIVPESQRTVYRMSFLAQGLARQAMVNPLHTRQYTVADSVQQDVLTRLTVEDQEVQPGPLQIVCRWLWAHRGRSEAPPVKDDEGRTVLGPASLYDDQTRTVDDILQHFFRGFLDQAPSQLRQHAGPLVQAYSDADLDRFVRVEILDLLGPLITADGTRNIVDGTQLIDVPFRRPLLRQAILNHLERNRILRREPRLDGEFYEITHEFLIEPILNALDSDRDHAALAQSLWALDRDALTDWELATLLAFDGLLELPPPFDEVMFRSMVRLGAERPTIRAWFGRCRQPVAPGTAGTASFALTIDDVDATDRLPLQRAELLRIAAQLDHLDESARLQQERRVGAVLLDSWLLAAEPADQPILKALVRRLARP